ncbi:MAG: hypothetical protein EXQ88_00190 [Alphaproteobacteria bacterium]|nr:hypothetical protein [Alphaproteobacteria bacterium]
MKLALISALSALAVCAIASAAVAQAFDAAAADKWSKVEIKQSAPGEALELVGKRAHPDTMVAESCGTKLRPYKGAVLPATEYIGAPDPQMLAMAKMLPADGPIKVSPDGKSIIMTALNSRWVWTFTPTAK